jgi:Glycosyltransferase family 87
VLTPIGITIAAATLLALALRVYLVVRPGLMAVTQYDDGPYVGSAVRLAHGAMPYRNFIFVQPPGITLVMSPVGLLTYVTGTAWGMVVARLLTALAGAAAVALGGLLVRHRGLLPVAVTCAVLALYPPSATAAHTVLLEPWLVLFCLAGALAAFDGDRLATTARRLAWGGAAFGFAGAIKGWAIVPVAVLLVLCLVRADGPRQAPGTPDAPAAAGGGLRRALVFGGGVAAGFLVPVVPFLLAAPRQFYDSVVVAQLARGGARTPVFHRLASLIGIGHMASWGHAVTLVVAVAVLAFVVGAQAAAWRSGGRPPPPLDWFAVVSAAIVTLMFLWPPYFTDHYAAFLAPFIGLAVALSVSRLAEGGGATPRARVWGRRAAWSGAAVAGVAMVWFGALLVVTMAHPRATTTPPTAITRAIPPGACVLSDQVSYLLLADRFVSDVPRCPQMVDGLGTDLALANGRGPANGAGAVPAVAKAWRQAFSHSQYVVLSAKNSLRVAWSPGLRAYFRAHFQAVVRHRDYTVYARRG